MKEFEHKPYTYLEGTDLVGKDTVGERVAQKMNIATVRTLSITPNNPYHLKLDTLDTKSKLFSPCVAKAIIHDIENSDWTENFVQVSFHALRAVIYEKALQKPLADIYEELLNYTPLFSSTILLTASIEAKKDRLAQRIGKASPLDQKIYTDPDFVIKMDNYLHHYAIKHYDAEVIDTSNLSIDEVTETAFNLSQKSSDVASINRMKIVNEKRKNEFSKNAFKIKEEIYSFEKFSDQ